MFPYKQLICIIHYIRHAWGGGSPHTQYTTGVSLETVSSRKFALKKGPFFTFCLTKGCLFGPRNAWDDMLYLPILIVLPIQSIDHSLSISLFWSPSPNKECGASITCNAMKSGAGCPGQWNNCLILSLSTWIVVHLAYDKDVGLHWYQWYFNSLMGKYA